MTQQERIKSLGTTGVSAYKAAVTHSGRSLSQIKILWHFMEIFDEITYTPYRVMDDFYRDLYCEDI